MSFLSVIFGSICIAYVLVLEIYVIYISKNWERVKAKVLKSELTNAEGDVESLECNILYSYEVKNNKYTNNKISPYNFATSFGNIHRKLLKKYSINTEVLIYFCPDNPKKAYLDLRAYRLGVISSAIIIGALFISLGLR